MSDDRHDHAIDALNYLYDGSDMLPPPGAADAKRDVISYIETVEYERDIWKSMAKSLAYSLSDSVQDAISNLAWAEERVRNTE